MRVSYDIDSPGVGSALAGHPPRGRLGRCFPVGDARWLADAIAVKEITRPVAADSLICGFLSKLENSDTPQE